MPLPSLYRSDDPRRAWNVGYAALGGAGIGALAGLFKILGPFRPAAGENLTNHWLEIAAAALAFAMLCAAAASLRNFLARRLIWDEDR